MGEIGIPEEFVLIDRIIHYHPDLAEILQKSPDVSFAMSADKCEALMRYNRGLIANWSPLLCVKKGDVLTYKGYKIHAV